MLRQKDISNLSVCNNRASVVNKTVLQGTVCLWWMFHGRPHSKRISRNVRNKPKLHLIFFLQQTKSTVIHLQWIYVIIGLILSQMTVEQHSLSKESYCRFSKWNWAPSLHYKCIRQQTIKQNAYCSQIMRTWLNPSILPASLSPSVLKDR